MMKADKTNGLMTDEVVTEKMCSLCDDETQEICSSGDYDTCGDGGLDVTGKTKLRGEQNGFAFYQYTKYKICSIFR